MTEQPGEKLENNTKDPVPLFDAADGKILATGDMFRGPSTGFTSDLDLNNPGRNLPEKEIIEDDLR